jgi:tRNA(Ile)-lysidine synthase
MLEKIEQKVLNFINLHNLLPDGAKVLLAVSGGADSVALVQILTGLKLAGRISGDFHIAHINHQLRGEKSLEDEEFVKTLAEKHNLPVSIERIEVKKYAKENKLSIETAARNLRLEKLTAIAQKNNCSCVVTAHQKNDNAETIIHRLLRGTGFKGLAGIRPKSVINGTIFIRPLLCLNRKEIEDYLLSQNIEWQTDHTNLDCRFTRNRIRHRILPTFRQDIIESLFELSQKSYSLFQKIERQAQKFISRSNLLDIDEFNNCPVILKIEIIQSLLQKYNIGLQKMTAEHYDNIIKFLQKPLGSKTLQLPNKIFIKKQQKSFYLCHPETCTEKLAPVPLKIPGSVCFADWIIETEILPADKCDIELVKKKKNNFIEWFDFELIKPPLVARCRQRGDRFKPFGLGISKKIGKFITSAKLGIDQRKKTFLVCDSEKTLWLAPVRRSSEAEITNTSKSLLQIKIKSTYIQDI